MNVLFVDHARSIGSAQRALLDLVCGLPSTIAPTVMCPKGDLRDMLRDLGVRVVQSVGPSRRHHRHPRRSVQLGSEVCLTALAVRRVAAARQAEIIHANSIRMGIAAAGARRLGAPPTVVHIHDALPRTGSADLARRSIRANTDAVITISDYVRRNFVGEGAQDGPYMVHSPLDWSKFHAAGLTKQAARHALGLEQTAKLVGLIAQITPRKGQETAIKALQRLRARHPEARLLLVGRVNGVESATRHDNISYERWLYRLVRALRLEDRVEFWGERDDVPTILRALDVLVAPSWEEPLGRSVIEGMSLQTPVIATNVGGPNEFITHGVDGLLLPPRLDEHWAVTLEWLLGDASLRENMGRRARNTVMASFGRGDYVSRVLQIYDGIVATPVGLNRGAQGVNRGSDLREPVCP
ncbi:MAG: L-malate glycosyltransferase [Solirubrobacteraceae bacterium]|nr:L-malate glycosyltransferase [Solirubrobacteraceae bacterium]